MFFVCIVCALTIIKNCKNFAKNYIKDFPIKYLCSLLAIGYFSFLEKNQFLDENLHVMKKQQCKHRNFFCNLAFKYQNWGFKMPKSGV